MEANILLALVCIGALAVGIIVGTIINNAASEGRVLWTAKLFGN